MDTSRKTKLEVLARQVIAERKTIKGIRGRLYTSDDPAYVEKQIRLRHRLYDGSGISAVPGVSGSKLYRPEPILDEAHCVPEPTMAEVVAEALRLQQLTKDQALEELEKLEPETKMTAENSKSEIVTRLALARCYNRINEDGATCPDM